MRVNLRASIAHTAAGKLIIQVQHSTVCHGTVFLWGARSWLWGKPKIAVIQLDWAYVLAGVHVVSLSSLLQPWDTVCRRGVCCCQQQHLRRGSCVQLQGGRYGSSSRCKWSLCHCASGRTPAETGSIAQGRTAGWHWAVCLLLFTVAGERNFSMALPFQLRALYGLFDNIAKEELCCFLCQLLFVYGFSVFLPCVVAESFVTSRILQEVKYKFLLHLETILEKANPVPLLFFRLSQGRPCSAVDLCSHWFPVLTGDAEW